MQYLYCPWFKEVGTEVEVIEVGMEPFAPPPLHAAGPILCRGRGSLITMVSSLKCPIMDSFDAFTHCLYGTIVTWLDKYVSSTYLWLHNYDRIGEIRALVVKSVQNLISRDRASLI